MRCEGLGHTIGIRNQGPIRGQHVGTLTCRRPVTWQSWHKESRHCSASYMSQRHTSTRSCPRAVGLTRQCVPWWVGALACSTIEQLHTSLPPCLHQPPIYRQVTPTSAFVVRPCCGLPYPRSIGVQGAFYIEDVGLPNVYTFTKNLAEQLMLDLHKVDFPVSIVRPTILSCLNGAPAPGYFGNNSGAIAFVMASATGDRFAPCLTLRRTKWHRSV